MSEIKANIKYRKHPDGKIEYRIRYTDPHTGKTKEKSKRGFKNQTLAKRAADEVYEKLRKGYILKDIGVSDYLDLWMEEYKKDASAPTYRTTLESHIRLHIKPFFGSRAITSITPEHCQTFANYLYRDKNLAHRTIENITGILRGAMTQAVKNRRIEFNPCDGLKNPAPRPQKSSEDQFVDSDDIPKVLDALLREDPPYHNFIKTLFFTGMRKGEAAALTPKDLFLKEENPYILVNKTLNMQPKSEDERFGEVKTRKARKVFIDDLTKQLLKDQMKIVEKNKRAYGDEYHIEYNFIFCRQNGAPIPKSTLARVFDRSCLRAIGKEYPIHSTRHSYVVLMLELGVDVEFIREQLGHGGLQITREVYMHVSRKIQTKNLTQINEYLNKVIE
ncbi:site-specific integrase [Chryseomicrobium palamuruense]